MPLGAWPRRMWVGVPMRENATGEGERGATRDAAGMRHRGGQPEAGPRRRLDEKVVAEGYHNDGARVDSGRGAVLL
jgi:hypothetical protein